MIRHALAQPLPPLAFGITVVITPFVGLPMLGTGPAVGHQAALYAADFAAVDMPPVAAAVDSEVAPTDGAIDKKYLQACSAWSEDLDPYCEA